MYYHFRSKGDLLLALVAEADSALRPQRGNAAGVARYVDYLLRLIAVASRVRYAATRRWRSRKST